jgi:hypothetical protein
MFNNWRGYGNAVFKPWKSKTVLRLYTFIKILNHLLTRVQKMKNWRPLLAERELKPWNDLRPCDTLYNQLIKNSTYYKHKIYNVAFMI